MSYVVNPKTKRKIKVGSNTYKKLVKEGILQVENNNEPVNNEDKEEKILDIIEDNVIENNEKDIENDLESSEDTLDLNDLTKKEVETIMNIASRLKISK